MLQLLKRAYDQLKSDMEKDDFYERESNLLLKEITDVVSKSQDCMDLLEYINEISLSKRADTVSAT